MARSIKSQSAAEPELLQIRGATHHNLRIERLDIPKKKLVVFTGVSGSGKSSLAFDTLYAEGQRRYVESLSSYARQFLGQMDKAHVEHIRGLSPTIAIEQKTASSNPRSTVGTITEVYDYLRVLYARVGVQHCPRCDRAVQALSTDQILAELGGMRGQVLLLAPLAENRKGEFREVLGSLRERGFVRVRVDGEVRRLDQELVLDKKVRHTLQLVVDRVVPEQTSRARLADSVESALREGKGALLVSGEQGERRFSQHRACVHCGLGLPELSPQSFSFNSPLGMCPSCNGLGRQEEMDPSLLIPDAKLSIRAGALAPWRSVMARGEGINFGMFEALSKQVGVDLDRPWNKLPAAHRQIVLRGMGDKSLQVKWKGRHGNVAWAMQWEGVLNTLMRRYRETKSEQMRQYYQQYLTEAACRLCGGAKLREESRAVRLAGHRIEEVADLPIARACELFRTLKLSRQQRLVADDVIREVLARLDFLRAVGLDYLTLSRLGPSLSGGEAQRIRLASQLGSELSGVMYVLDEPSIGLHQRDNERLIETLRRLRDLGNTLIVVEHDRETIQAADHVVDFGPGAGALGGQVTFCGPPAKLAQSDTLTGKYLRGALRIEVPRERRRPSGHLRILGAAENNLKNLDVAFPLGTLTAVTGVSGAGKSSLVTGILYPALCRNLHGSTAPVGTHRRIEGLQGIDKAIHIDQAPIGRTPRSNPATYTKCFDLIRDLFAGTPEARAQGYAAGRFSFNVAGGRCETCEGDGVIRVQMHFLPDVYVPCEVCRGKRYNEATLAVRYKGLTIAEVLATSVRDAVQLFSAHPKLRRILQTLSDVGLDYLQLGQPAPTLSGGEAQRVKLSRELARKDTGKTLYVLDEPTTGLHFDDIRKLLDVLRTLVGAGNTVVVIEHNLDVIKCADWVIDLGPEGGDRGGQVVSCGTPEQVASDERSVTGKYLRSVLEN
jgi:excinuclease ABC subunit A